MNELKRLLPYIRRHRWKIALGFAFVTISNICSTYIPRLVGSIVDTIKGGDFEMESILAQIGYMLALVAASGLFMFFTRRTIVTSSRLIEYDLRNDFVNVIERQPMDFFQNHGAGELMAHATNDISAAREFLGPAVMYAANTVTTFSLALYYMLSLNAEITLVALAPTPLIAVTVYLIGRKIHVAYRNVQEKFADLTAYSQESISGLRIVKSYQREKYESEKFAEMSRDYYKKSMIHTRYQVITMPVLMILVGISQLLILGYGGLLAIDGKATLGDITQFIIYLNLLIWPIAAIGWITNIIQRASASAGRLGKIFDRANAQVEIDSGSGKKIEMTGDFEYKNVDFYFKESETKILDSLNLNIPGGSILGITGPIGSGKTSIINLLLRLYKPSSGSIYLNNININDLPLLPYRRGIGAVPQEPFLFSMTIWENLTFAKPSATESEVIEASKAAEFHKEVLEFKDGYQTILGERGITLSGGQKQRLAIARALIKNPDMLILDDALSAVDTGTEERILSNFKKIFENKTVILVSHRISSIKNADNIIYLKNGRIIEAGNHNELIGKNGNYHKLYTRQKLEQELGLI